MRTCASAGINIHTGASFQLELGGQQKIDWDIHFVPCSDIASAARQCEFKDLERRPRRQTVTGLECSDLMMAVTGLLFIIQRNKSGNALSSLPHSCVENVCILNLHVRTTLNLELLGLC